MGGLGVVEWKSSCGSVSVVHLKALFDRAVARGKACSTKQCVRVWNAARRPASSGALFLSYAGIIAAIAFGAYASAQGRSDIKAEAHHREADICMVIINVHENAKFRASTERQALKGTLDYLNDHRDDNSDLVRRVRQNLPNAQANAATAEQNVRATTVPPTCKPYVPKEK